MESFSNFLITKELQESIDSPIEFYMTEDTKMPREIYAAFKINDEDYGASLILSQWDNVYLLDVYRVVKVKKRMWQFKSSADIRQGLSTAIKFFESCYPFIKQKMDGVIIQLPAKKQSEKYVNFLEKIIKKSYIKQYETIPVNKTSEKARNYLFLVRKGVNPESLFTSVTFTKHFSFDGTVDSEVLDQGSEYYKNIPNKVSLEPDEVLAFGKIETELTATPELISDLNKAVEKHKEKKGDSDKAKDSEGKILKITPFSETIKENDHFVTIPLAHVLAYCLPNAFKNIREKGYNEDKLDLSNLQYAFCTNKAVMSKNMIEAMKKYNYMNSDESLNLQNQDIYDAMKSFKQVEIDNLADSTSFLAQKKKEENISSGSANSVIYDKLELEQEPVVTAEPFLSGNESKYDNGEMGFQEGDIENKYEKQNYIKKMPEVANWMNSVSENPPSAGSKTLKDYTNGFACECNPELRQQIKEKRLNYNELDPKIKTLINYFEKEAPRISDSVWVYRNADDPNVPYGIGENIVDAAVLSTSVDSKMSLGSGGNTRLKIYLPAGTKCFPCFDNFSHHSSEAEIALPPYSILKVIEAVEVKKHGNTKYLYTCIYIGSALKSFKKKTKNGSILLENDMESDSKYTFVKSPSEDEELDYDPEAKWSDPFAEGSSEIISKLIEEGKLEIEQ
jgi:hypothetical protein